MKLDNIEILENGRKLPLVEDFYTVQGEGRHTGKPAYFIRLGGCDVGCSWCDAKMTWNPNMYPPTDVDEIVNRALKFAARSIVITGGEPALYPLDYLTGQLHAAGLEIFLETSGSSPLSGMFDWICLSPKRKLGPLEDNLQRADELKVIIQDESDFEWAEQNAKLVRKNCLLYLQPEWSRYNDMIHTIVEYVKSNPKWNISLQSHKFMRIP